MNHIQAQDIIENEFLEYGQPFIIINKDRTRILGAIAFIETQYGQGWKGSGKGSHNWGAIQAGSSWKGETFEYVDTHPLPDGTSQTYRVAFRKYPNDADGAKDLIRVAYVNRPSVLEAAERGDVYEVSKHLYLTHYYEGFGKTSNDRIKNHYRALDKAYQAILKAEQPLLKPVIRRGSGYYSDEERDYVREWQRFIGVNADGLFGTVTEQETKDIQVEARIKIDGVVGPVTWGLIND